MEPLNVQELYDLRDAMMARLGSEQLFTAITRANRMGDLPELLESLGMADLLPEPPDEQATYAGKVIVLGDSAVKEDKLRSIIRKKGMDPDRFEFHLEYNRLKHFDFSKIRGSMGYVAILAGPMPHSTPGKVDASSFVAQVENNPGQYPPMFRMGAGHELKITNNSFKNALGWLESIGVQLRG
ncbi:hypothetical protein [Paratractidigestivibacter sp.]|uniref:hypothetical protein n=1 Tax=Paratractidigestivibacter sp. TaxID=2847316 RepID=UPI002ABD7253|nr:hypothetical protein [Paratractidigestivibacter sp.]